MAEGKLIYADTVVEKISELILLDEHEKKVLDSFVEKCMAVEAVEVVRCKDCIHFNKEKALRPGGIWCEYWGTDPDTEDFCCKGERKDNG